MVEKHNHLRVDLDCGEEVHRSVKNCNPRQGYLRQRLVGQTKWILFFSIKKCLELKSSEAKFLV